MSTFPQPDPWFVELVQRVLDGEATQPDLTTLSDTIVRDPAARGYYTEMMLLDGALADELQQVAGQPQGGITPFPGSDAGPRSILRRHKGFAVAAALTLIATVATLIRSVSGPDPLLFEVASVRSTDPGFQAAVGDPITAGQILKLSHGVVGIHSPDGNQLILQGPGELQVLAADHLRMTSGRLLAELNGPPLRIEVPNAVITDLGTTFGVHQQASGFTRVDVFDGRVRFAHPEQPSLAAELSQGESLQMNGSNWRPVIGKADRSLYPSTALSPVGITFAMRPDDAKVIESSAYNGVAWLATTQETGIRQLPNTPVSVRWVGSHLHPHPHSPTQGNALLPSARLCGKSWFGSVQTAANSMGFDEFNNGIIIQFRHLKPWLEQVGASAYRVTLWTNLREPHAVKTLPSFTIYASESLKDQPLMVWDQDADKDIIRVEPAQRGVREKQLDHQFTSSSLTIRLTSESSTEGPSNLSAVILTPVIERDVP